MSETPIVPEPEGIFMMECVVPAFFDATRALIEERPDAASLADGLIQMLRTNAKTVDVNGESSEVWLAAAEVCRAVLIERRAAMKLVENAEALDQRPGYAWKTLCTLCYIGGSVDPNVEILLAINLQMAVAEFICRATVHLSEVYERSIADWFAVYWTRKFTAARFRFTAPKLVEPDLRRAIASDPAVRVQRVLQAIADGLSVPLPERGREWFKMTVPAMNQTP